MGDNGRCWLNRINIRCKCEKYLQARRNAPLNRSVDNDKRGSKRTSFVPSLSGALNSRFRVRFLYAVWEILMISRTTTASISCANKHVYHSPIVHELVSAASCETRVARESLGFSRHHRGGEEPRWRSTKRFQRVNRPWSDRMHVVLHLLPFCLETRRNPRRTRLNAKRVIARDTISADWCPLFLFLSRTRIELVNAKVKAFRCYRVYSFHTFAGTCLVGKSVEKNEKQKVKLTIINSRQLSQSSRIDDARRECVDLSYAYVIEMAF